MDPEEDGLHVDHCVSCLGGGAAAKTNALCDSNVGATKSPKEKTDTSHEPECICASRPGTHDPRTETFDNDDGASLTTSFQDHSHDLLWDLCSLHLRRTSLITSFEDLL